MYFGHLSNITFMLTLTYQMLSTFLSLLAMVRRKHYSVLHQPLPLPMPLPMPIMSQSSNASNAKGPSPRPSSLICLTWLIYSIALPSEFLVAIGYWWFEYDHARPMTNIDLYKHGIIAFLLLLDGNVLGRIPLRAKHWRGVFVYGTLYILWTMVSSYYMLGEKRGVIYRVIDWREDPGKAAEVSFLLMVVMGPLVFSACWLISVSGGCCSCDYSAARRRVLTNVYSEVIAVNHDMNMDMDMDVGVMDACENGSLVGGYDCFEQDTVDTLSLYS